MVESSRKEYKRLKTELEMVEGGTLDDELPNICKKIDELVDFISSPFHVSILLTIYLS